MAESTPLMRGFGSRAQNALLPRDRHGRRGISPLLVAVCIAALLQGCAHLGAGGGDERSFRGIRWGTSLQDLREMEVVEEADGFARAVRKGEDLRFGDLRLDRITYQFKENVLFAATVHFSGATNFLALKQHLDDRYGRPSIAHADANVFSWNGGKVAVSLRYYRMAGTGEATYTYLPLALGNAAT